MTNSIEIENYKSIKHLKLETARVNVFIGEPNSGKSNILEALGLLSMGVTRNEYFKDILRFDNTGQLFFDSDTNRILKVVTTDLGFSLKLSKQSNGDLDNIFKGEYQTNGKNTSGFDLRFDGSIINSNRQFENTYKYYCYENGPLEQVNFTNYLNPPYGDNLVNILVNNPSLRKIVSDIFKRKDLRLQLNPVDNTIGAVKEVDDIIFNYPYKAVSETIRRFIFYKLAIATNQGSSLIFDEPEAHTFPAYTREIGELIALTEENQFFIATHNPYLLRSIFYKAPQTEVKVFVTTLKNYETQCRAIESDELAELLEQDIDLFFNLPE